MPNFSQYKDAYTTIRLERTENGILLMTLHASGGSYVWDARKETGIPHQEMGEALNAIARDPENRVVILTGTGDQFSGPQATSTTRSRGDARHWEHLQTDGRRMLLDFLDIPAPVISCINGPAWRHAEIPLMADIVLAADDAVIQDSAHFVNGMVPGDGIALVIPFLIGWNRGRYFHLMGQRLDASEMKSLGLVNEVMPREQLLPRAWEIAESLAARNPLLLRHTRTVLTGPLKTLLQQYLDHGLAVEALSALDDSMR